MYEIGRMPEDGFGSGRGKSVLYHRKGSFMDMVAQLWMLKQIYQDENRYFDEASGQWLYRIPKTIPPEDLEALNAAGHGPNQMFLPSHGKVLEELARRSAAWSLQEAANAFLAGLWSAPFLWQSALTAKVLAMGIPPHSHEPFGNSADTCAVCGCRERAVDVAQEWYFCMTEGTPLDGDPAGNVLALREMEKMGSRPMPVDYDVWTFRAVLAVIRSMPPHARYSKVRDALWKEKLLPTSKKWVYGKLLETLSFLGILDTEEYPGMAVSFTPYWKREERPNVRVEVQAPLAWWDSSIGIHEGVLEKIFPWIDISPVDLAKRPTPMPPLCRTVTGCLEQKRAPRKSYPKSPDAGKGPARAGDVYAVHIREGVWVTIYCHRIEGNKAVVEFLEGVFEEFPGKGQIQLLARPRRDGRWLTKASGIDRHPGVRRVARDMEAPKAASPEPEKLSFSQAGSLKSLAWWCFGEL